MMVAQLLEHMGYFYPIVFLYYFLPNVAAHNTLINEQFNCTKCLQERLCTEQSILVLITYCIHYNTVKRFRTNVYDINCVKAMPD